jgi:hypothetical protein
MFNLDHPQSVVAVQHQVVFSPALPRLAVEDARAKTHRLGLSRGIRQAAQDDRYRVGEAACDRFRRASA